MLPHSCHRIVANRKTKLERGARRSGRHSETVARARPIGVHVRPHIMRNLLPTSDKSIHFRKWLALWKWLWKSRVHASLTLVTATASPSHSNSPRDIGREALRLEFFENTTLSRPSHFLSIYMWKWNVRLNKWKCRSYNRDLWTLMIF